MTYTPITTHVIDAPNRLLSQFTPNADATIGNVAKQVQAYSQQIQQVEDAFRDLSRMRNPSYYQTLGSWQVLDDIGSLVGVQRETALDGSQGQDYWIRVKYQPLINKSNASGWDIANVLNLMYGSYGIIMYQGVTAEFVVQLPNANPITQAVGAQIQRILRQMTAAGVKYFFTYYTTAKYFGWLEDVGTRRGIWLESTFNIGGFAY